MTQFITFLKGFWLALVLYLVAYFVGVFTSPFFGTDEETSLPIKLFVHPFLGAYSLAVFAVVIVSIYMLGTLLPSRKKGE